MSKQDEDSTGNGVTDPFDQKALRLNRSFADGSFQSLRP
jgi:hypothetical protein